MHGPCSGQTPTMQSFKDEGGSCGGVTGGPGVTVNTFVNLDSRSIQPGRDACVTH